MPTKNPNPPYVIDGHEFDNEESEMLGDGMFPPFGIFDTAAQDYVLPFYPTREAALAALAGITSDPETLARAADWFPTREAHIAFRDGDPAGVCRHLKAGETYNSDTDSLMSSPLRHADSWAHACEVDRLTVSAIAL